MRNNTPTDTRPDQAQPGPHVHFTGPFALTTEADPENEAPNSNRPSACAAPGKLIVKWPAGRTPGPRKGGQRGKASGRGQAPRVSWCRKTRAQSPRHKPVR